MKAFIVSNVYTAAQRYKAAHCTHAVSFRDHSFEYPEFVIADHNWLRFVMYDRHFDEGTPQYNEIRDFVAKLIDWVRGLPEEAVVSFNCQMGISRSTAACLIACVIRYGFDEGSKLFFNKVGHDGCAPNQTLLHHADVMLGLEGKLEKFGESVYAFYRSMYGEQALVPHRKDGEAPPHDPWDEQ